MFRIGHVTLVVMLFLSLAGCSGVRPVRGGTSGELHTSGDPLGDIQISIYEVDGTAFENIGFAATKADGTFELVTPGAKGPLHLSAGEYCCTLESVGAPVVIPKEYMKPETTPLKVTWESGDTILDLEIQLAKKTR